MSLYVLGGLAVLLIILEVGLRLTGIAFNYQQDAYNNERMALRADCTILCLGESTPAMGGEHTYPKLLETILNDNSSGETYSVLNKGLPATDTSVIMSQLKTNLEKFKPDVVVSMMGANDENGAIPRYDLPLAELPGFPYDLRVFRLFSLLHHQLFNTRQIGVSVQVSLPSQQNIEPYLLVFYQVLPRYNFDLVVDYSQPAVARLGPVICYLIELARYYEVNGGLIAADKLLKRAIRLRPSVYTYMEYALYLERRSEFAEAEKALLTAIKADPNNGMPWVLLGRVRLRDNRFSEGWEAAEKGAALIENDFRVPQSLSNWYRQNGNDEGAWKHSIRAVQMAEGQQLTFESLFELATRLDKLDELERVIGGILEKDLTVDVLCNIQRYYDTQENHDKSAELQERIRRKRLAEVHPMTKDNYLRLVELASQRQIPVVAVQYPTRNIEPLKAIFKNPTGIEFVDNQENFLDALQEHPYEEIFMDRGYGDFGHATPLGNRILAEKVAPAALRACQEARSSNH